MTESNKKILNQIESPKDLKNLSKAELISLAAEIKDLLITSVQETGGHLSSNLGVIELTIALHYVYNSPDDVLIWDVGHQTYVHKILTGRKNKLHTLRQFKGISGFQKEMKVYMIISELDIQVLLYLLLLEFLRQCLKINLIINRLQLLVTER